MLEDFKSMKFKFWKNIWNIKTKQCKKLLKQMITLNKLDILIGWFWLFFKVGTYMFSYYYNTSILQMYYHFCD